MISIREYLEESGHSPFKTWLDRLNPAAATKVSAVLVRLEYGNFSNVKGVGSGVFEYRIDFGPGYRLYFGKDGEKLILLLLGGSKKRQQNDIQKAQKYWQDYKHRKKQGNKK